MSMTRSYKFQKRLLVCNSALYGRFQSFPDALDQSRNFDTGAQSGFWVNVNAMRNGVDVAQAFVASPEFQSIYGTTQVSAGLITEFYIHILVRPEHLRSVFGLAEQLVSHPAPTLVRIMQFPSSSNPFHSLP